MQPFILPTAVVLVLAPLLAWRLYSRLRRMVGRQRLSRTRLWLTLTLFPALVVLLAVVPMPHPAAMVWLAAGLGAGALLGVYGLRLTTFEATPAGWFYTPNAHLGIALSLLLACRVLYRGVELYAMGPAVVAAAPGLVGSPLTLAVFGTLAGYYIAYAIGLVRWRLRAP